MTDRIPEPWEVGFGNPHRPYIVAITKEATAFLDPKTTVTGGSPTGGGPFFGAFTGPANAQRIVAAVNACEGLTNKQLEDGLIKELLSFVIMVSSGLVYESGYLTDTADEILDRFEVHYDKEEEN